MRLVPLLDLPLDMTRLAAACKVKAKDLAHLNLCRESAAQEALAKGEQALRAEYAPGWFGLTGQRLAEYQARRGKLQQVMAEARTLLMSETQAEERHLREEYSALLPVGQFEAIWQEAKRQVEAVDAVRRIEALPEPSPWQVLVFMAKVGVVVATACWLVSGLVTAVMGDKDKGS